MKKIAIITILILVGYGAYWLIKPLFVSKSSDEKIDDISVIKDDPMKYEVYSQGEFMGVENHKAKGTAKLIKVDAFNYVRFEDDFEVTNGPDLHVYLGRNGNYDPTANIGKLKGSSGGQNYEVPSEVDVNNYNEVWVWCKAFSVPFAKASLR